MSLLRRKNLKAAGVRLSGGLGWHAAPRTQTALLRALLQSMRPLDPGIELIRIGPENDGGYLVPDDLDGIRHAFSPGVSNESGFEAQLADRGMQVFLADHSVDRPAVAHPRFVFDKRFVGCLTDERYITLDDWHADKLGADSDAELLLQMDIEGAEYETLLAASPRLLGRFRIMVIEFHWLPQLWNEPFFADRGARVRQAARDACRRPHSSEQLLRQRQERGARDTANRRVHAAAPRSPALDGLIARRSRTRSIGRTSRRNRCS